MMAPAARPPRMPNPTPQPRQPAWAALGAKTAASANTPAAAIAVIVVFMFLPRSRNDRVAIVRFYPGFLKTTSIHPRAGTGYLGCPQAAVRPFGYADSDMRPESRQPYFNQPSQFVRNLLNAV